MTSQNYSLLAGTIFLLVTLLHLSRIIFGGTVVIANWVVPIWLSWGGLVGAGFLAWQGLKLSKRA